jgi:DNA-binding CsgD family transcriptional regulator
MTHTNVRSEQRWAIALMVLLGTIASLVIIDVIGDRGDGATAGHVALELGAASVALVALVGAAIRAVRLGREAKALRFENVELAESNSALAVALDVSRGEVVRWQAESQQWRDEARGFIDGLGQAIDRQFDRWGLSAAEREVALLLLKGLAHREIAEMRGVGEVTVRQQARSLYRKSGLSGRADLAAFFLEDLLAGSAPEESTKPGHEAAEDREL